MGCTSDVVTSGERRKGINRTSELFLNVTKLIKDNPFYEITLSNFENFLDYLNDKKNFDVENIINETVIKYLGNQEQYIKKLFIDVVKNLLSKLEAILPNNNDLIILILFFLYIFISDNQTGKRKLFKEKLIILFNKTKNDKNEYYISKITNIILFLIQMYTFSFSSFFVFFALWDYFDESNQYEDLINNNSVIKEVDSIIKKHLKDLNMNENISPYFLNVLVISEINNKIKFIFEKVEEGKTTISLDDEEINIIADSIFDSIYINNYVDYLFFGENHEY